MDGVAAGQHSARNAKGARKLAVMVALPAALALAGGYFWLFGGRYVDTNNAYVGRDMVTVSSDISGRITSVKVAENQAVKAGDVLFTFDDAPYKLALQESEAGVVDARAQVAELKAAYTQGQAQVAQAQANLALQQKQYDRYKTLAASNAASQSQLDDAAYALKAAAAGLSVAKDTAAKALAALEDSPTMAIDERALVKQAVAKRDQAVIDLSHTIVIAPADGIVTQTGKLQVGQYLQPGVPVFELVKTARTWVDANFKETQLTHMQVGQPAVVEVDTYPGVVLHGVVVSIGAGTGAQFSVLPAENATGNWVKVVQRVPVRVLLDAPPAGVVLRAGLSADVDVDTGRTRLQRMLDGR